MSAFDAAELLVTLDKIADKSGTVKGNGQLCLDASARLRALLAFVVKRPAADQARVAKPLAAAAGDFLQMLRVQNHYRFLLFWLATSQRVVGSVKQVHVAVSAMYAELDAEPDMSEQQWLDMLNAGRLEQQRWLQEALASSTNAMLINEMPNPLKLKETLATMDNQLKLRFNESNVEEDAAALVKMRPEMAQLMQATRERILNHTNMNPGEAFEWYISQEDIKRGELIGEGSYGKVYRATLTHQLTGEKEEVALKVLQSMHGLDENRKFAREIEAWVKLEDDHVLQMIGANHISKPKFFIMEYASEGNLELFFRDIDDKGNKKLLWFLLGQAAKGLKVLHDENVEHGGLKTTNLLVDKTKDGDLVVKISDFGMSVIRTESVSVSTHAKKDMVRWKAPERLMQSTDGTDFRKADIYGLGLCGIDAASGMPPFMDRDDEAIIEIKLENERVPRPENGLTDEEWAFLDKMCDPDPSLRPDLDEVIATMQTLDKARQDNWSSIESAVAA